MSKHWMDGTPTILTETGTPLPEDRFWVVDLESGYPEVRCRVCRNMVTPIEPNDDLNTLIRLSFQHLIDCRGKADNIEESTDD